MTRHSQDITRNDMARWWPETRVLWDMLLEAGATPGVVTHYACRLATAYMKTARYRCEPGGSNMAWRGPNDWQWLEHWNMQPLLMPEHFPLTLVKEYYDFGPQASIRRNCAKRKS